MPNEKRHLNNVIIEIYENSRGFESQSMSL